MLTASFGSVFGYLQSSNVCFSSVLVGGIYTVIRSKSFVSTEELGDQYVLFGPYKEACARTEVEELDFPAGSPLSKAVSNFRDMGFKVPRISSIVADTFTVSVICEKKKVSRF